MYHEFVAEPAETLRYTCIMNLKLKRTAATARKHQVQRTAIPFISSAAMDAQTT